MSQRPRKKFGRRIVGRVLLVLLGLLVIFIVLDFDWSPRDRHAPTMIVSHAGFDWIVTPDYYLRAKGLDVPDLPTEENAAFDYLAAAEMLPPRPKDKDQRAVFWEQHDYVMRHGWPGECELLWSYLAAAEPAFEQASRGIVKARAKWPIRMNDELLYNAEYPGLAGARSLGRGLVCKGWLAVAEGDEEEALEDFLAPLQLGIHLAEGPSLIYFLVGAAVNDIGLTALERWVLSNPSPRVLGGALTRLRQIEARLPGVATVVSGERALALNYVDSFGKFTRDELGGLHLCSLEGPVLGRSRTLRSKMKRATEALFDKVADVEGVTGPARQRALAKARGAVYASPGDRWAGLAGGFAQLALEAHTRHGFLELRYAAAEVRIGLALYKGEHGGYPDTLDEIKPYLGTIPLDPYVEEPFHYRLEGDGYVFYSVGPNLQDDGGLDQRVDKTKIPDLRWGETLFRPIGQAAVPPAGDDLVFPSHLAPAPPFEEYVKHDGRRPAEGWSTERHAEE